MRPVTTAQITVSMMTAPQCRDRHAEGLHVTPAEYMSLVMTECSWRMAKIGTV